MRLSPHLGRNNCRDKFRATLKERAKGRVVTIAIDAMKFLKPIRVGDVLEVYTEIESVGCTSMKIHIEVTALPDLYVPRGSRCHWVGPDKRGVNPTPETFRKDAGSAAGVSRTRPVFGCASGHYRANPAGKGLPGGEALRRRARASLFGTAGVAALDAESTKKRKPEHRAGPDDPKLK